MISDCIVPIIVIVIAFPTPRHTIYSQWRVAFLFWIHVACSPAYNLLLCYISIPFYRSSYVSFGLSALNIYIYKYLCVNVHLYVWKMFLFLSQSYCFFCICLSSVLCAFWNVWLMPYNERTQRDACLHLPLSDTCKCNFCSLESFIVKSTESRKKTVAHTIFNFQFSTFNTHTHPNQHTYTYLLFNKI